MSYYPTSTTPFETAGLSERCEVNGHHFKRARGTQKWIEYQPEEFDQPYSHVDPLYLSLVHQKQGQGEPLHWLLFVARENKPGLVYQVKGDAEFMTYRPSNIPINVLNSASFHNIYNLAVITEQQATVVKQVADNEHPPRAPNRQSVRENCQGWTVRVIAKLVERGIVPASKLNMARSMMEPV